MEDEAENEDGAGPAPETEPDGRAHPDADPGLEPGPDAPASRAVDRDPASSAADRDPASRAVDRDPGPEAGRAGGPAGESGEAAESGEAGDRPTGGVPAVGERAPAPDPGRDVDPAADGDPAAVGSAQAADADPAVDADLPAVGERAPAPDPGRDVDPAADGDPAAVGSAQATGAGGDGEVAVRADPSGARAEGADAGVEPGTGEGADSGADEGGGRRRSRAGRTRDWTTWRRRGRVAAFALAGAVIALGLAGRVKAHVGPFDTTVAVRPSWTGDTLLRLPPLGSIGLDTHDWPLRLELRVDELGLDEAQRYAQNPELLDRVGDNLADQVGDALRALALRCFLVALAGGVAGALVARLSWRSAGTGLALGALVVVGVGGGAAATFDAGAVAEPRYSGLLTAAPTAVGDVEAIVERFGEYRAQLSDLVSNIVVLYRAGENLPTFQPTDGMVRLLHVSDVHLNPTAFDIMRQVVDEFGVDAIVDTGDTTDWGTATEDAIVDEIGSFDIPYVWIRGNHDSRRIQRAVAHQPNARVLDGDATEVAGLRIWGIGDPRYTPNKEELGDSRSERERAEDFAPELAERLAEAEPPEVDIVMTHDPTTAAELGGEVPLVLAGHRHDASEERLDEDTLLLVEGSTGGAGLRGLQGEEPEPLTCSVLYFDPETGRLVAYDRITVEGLGQTGATIDRHVVADEEDPAVTTTTEPTDTDATGTDATGSTTSTSTTEP